MDAEVQFEAFSDLTNIQKFFYGQSVFLTGVTGFVGKVVLEKILRCCPGVGMIYILMRAKKGLTAQQRIEKIFNRELFSKVKEVFPRFREIVHIVEGDITKYNLGMSLEDTERIRENVSIFLHSAASVRYNDPIKVAADNNLFSMKRVLELCREMPHLQAFVHVSTAYLDVKEDGTVLEELPTCKVEPSKLMDALEWMDEKCQAAVEEFLLENNNGQIITYLVTKALSEVLINEEKGDIPIAILRPCYTLPTWKDPIPGWVDQIQGVSGLMLAGAKGVLRVLKSPKNVKVNFSPVDIVANSIIASAWHVGTTKPAHPFIVNCVTDPNLLPLAEEALLKPILEKRHEYPLANMFRYPDLTVYYNDFAFYLHSIIDQWIPALIIDLLLLIFIRKTILVKVYYKIYYLYTTIFYKIIERQLIHRRENYVALEKKLVGEDKDIFLMNTDNLNWVEYIDICMRGGRTYLAHEDFSNIEYAKKKAKIWLAVTTILKWLIIAYLMYYFCSNSLMKPLYNAVEEKIHVVFK